MVLRVQDSLHGLSAGLSAGLSCPGLSAGLSAGLSCPGLSAGLSPRWWYCVHAARLTLFSPRAGGPGRASRGVAAPAQRRGRRLVPKVHVRRKGWNSSE